MAIMNWDTGISKQGHGTILLNDNFLKKFGKKVLKTRTLERSKLEVAGTFPGLESANRWGYRPVA